MTESQSEETVAAIVEVLGEAAEKIAALGGAEAFIVERAAIVVVTSSVEGETVIESWGYPLHVGMDSQLGMLDYAATTVRSMVMHQVYDYDDDDE